MFCEGRIRHSGTPARNAPGGKLTEFSRKLYKVQVSRCGILLSISEVSAKLPLRKK
jgi:hypothetical protein